MILTEPSIAFGQQIRAYRQEFLDSDDSMDGTGRLRHYADPAEWIAYLHAHEDLQYLYVREQDRKIVGMLQLRPVMNDYLEKFGGHIGYSVVPSERCKGYATQMLRDALPICRKLKIEHVLITCNAGNEGSRRTILRNGGVYESTVEEPDEGPVERYWIHLPG